MIVVGILENFLSFVGKDYDYWSVKIDAILGFQEVGEVVKIGFQEPPKNVGEKLKTIFKENKKLNFKARVLLHQCIPITIFQKILEVAISK